MVHIAISCESMYTYPIHLRCPPAFLLLPIHHSFLRCVCLRVWVCTRACVCKYFISINTKADKQWVAFVVWKLYLWTIKSILFAELVRRMKSHVEKFLITIEYIYIYMCVRVFNLFCILLCARVRVLVFRLFKPSSLIAQWSNERTKTNENKTKTRKKYHDHI